MGPNKKKSYLRKLAKKGFTKTQVMEVIDRFNAQVSYHQTNGDFLHDNNGGEFQELQNLIAVCSEIGLAYDDIMELDSRPYLVSYLSPRLNNYDFKAMTFEDVWNEALCDNSSDFMGYENTILTIPEFDYGCYFQIYEKDMASHLQITSEFATHSEVIRDLKVLQNQFNFNYVVIHIKTESGCMKTIMDFTQKDEQGNFHHFLVS